MNEKLVYKELEDEEIVAAQEDWMAGYMEALDEMEEDDERG